MAGVLEQILSVSRLKHHGPMVAERVICLPHEYCIKLRTMQQLASAAKQLTGSGDCAGD